jgi:hypothetical protein
MGGLECFAFLFCRILNQDFEYSSQLFFLFIIFLVLASGLRSNGDSFHPYRLPLIFSTSAFNSPLSASLLGHWIPKPSSSFGLGIM